MINTKRKLIKVLYKYKQREKLGESMRNIKRTLKKLNINNERKPREIKKIYLIFLGIMVRGFNPLHYSGF